MFSNDFCPNEEYFTNKKNCNNIEAISSNFEIKINFKINGIQTQKLCFLNGEKIDLKGLIQLRLSEKNDQSKMYISTIDMSSFNELKQDQSLHVTFPGFVDNLVKILNDCKKGNLQINLVNGREDQLVLQFYEIRPFKNLTHLCLPIKVAPLTVVLFYINTTLESLQTKNTSYENTIQCLQHELTNSSKRIAHLERDNVKLKEDCLEHDKLTNNRHKEEMYNLQESLKKVSELREAENERGKQTISALQAKIDKLTKETLTLFTEKSQEIKKSETLKEEICLLKSNVANLKEQHEKLHGEIAALKNLERKNDMHMGDSKKQILEMQEKLKKYEKLKSELIAEIEAEKKICHTKRSALEMATDEISKANEIICKQSQELIKLKQTIGWRTEVALQQERAIKEKEKIIAIKNGQIQNLQASVEKLREEIPGQLDSMKKMANAIENKYSEKIKDLNRRFGTSNKGTKSILGDRNKCNF